MRLVQATDDKGQWVTCMECGEKLPLAEALADLDGPAFRAYYHVGHTPEKATRTQPKPAHTFERRGLSETLWCLTCDSPYCESA